jgi:hypothetical protein
LLISGVNFVTISKLLSLSNIYSKKFFFFFSVSAEIFRKNILVVDRNISSPSAIVQLDAIQYYR